MYSMKATVQLHSWAMDRMWNSSLTALCCPLVDTLKYSRYFSYVVSVSFLWCSEWGRVELYEVRKLRRIKIIMWLDRLLLSDHRGRSEQRVNGEQTHLLRPQLSRLLPSDCSTSAFWLLQGFFLIEPQTTGERFCQFPLQGNTCDAVLKRQELISCVYGSHFIYTQQLNAHSQPHLSLW